MRAEAAPLASTLARSPARSTIAPCLALAVASLALPSALGYDPWAWLVWGRELAHGTLDTTGGPSWKPLPSLLIVPLTPLGDATPAAWLVVVRAAALAAPLLAFRIAHRLTGSAAAGVVAGVAVVLCADAFITALRGYSEPLLTASVLAAVYAWLRGRPLAALVALAIAGLARPEAWPFCLLAGVAVARMRRHEPGGAVAPLALAVLAPCVWLALDLIGSGDALRSGEVADASLQGTGGKASDPALAVLGNLFEAVIAPVLVLAAVGFAVAVRRRQRPVLALSAMTAGWAAIVAIMAEAGFTGSRRYLAVPATLLCVIAGIGFDALRLRLPTGRLRLIGAGVAVVAFAAFGATRARTDVRLLRLATRQETQLRDLRLAVRRAGGADAVRRSGTVVVNPYVQSALAWRLRMPLSHVVGTWTPRSQRRVTLPAIVFRAPAKLAGRRPVVPPGARAEQVAAAGGWRVLRVSAP
jgi:hypothetical protein